MNKLKRWFHPDDLTRDLLLFFTACAILALVVFGYLASLPGDGGGALGFSPARLVLLAFVLLIFIIDLWIASNIRRGGTVYRAILAGLGKRAGRVSFVLGIIVTIFGVVILAILNSLYLGTGEYRYFAYQERLLPIACLMVATFILWSVILFRHDERFKEFRSHIDRRSVWVGGVIWLVFGMLWLFAKITGIGLIPDEIGWEAPTVPLLEWQILIAWLASGIFIAFQASRYGKAITSSKADVVVMSILWLSAVAIWASQPVPDGFFAIRRPPNFEPYPFSDGQFYDIFAQNLLVGNGFKGNEIPPRPLYILLLAVFHFFAGQDYEAVIFLQTLVLAFIPVGLYLIGRELHSRSAGVFIAWLAIFREFTAIVSTPFTDNISNSKLYFADLPTALAIIWTVWVVLVWLRSDDKRSWLAIAAGGMLGVCLLFRTQTVFFVPVIFLFVILYKRGWRKTLGQMILFVIGTLLTVMPWLLRSHQITGQFAFDHAESQTRVMALRYLPTHESPDQLPGESLADYNDRLFGIIIQTALDDPGYVAKFVTGHWINSEIGNLLVLPVRDGLNSIGELWQPSYAFWQAWDGDTNTRQALLMLMNLIIISIGVAAAYKRIGWLGLFPLAINFVYNLSNAMARNSGLRYLLPTDWVSYTYYAIGLIQVTIFVMSCVGIDLTENNIEARRHIDRVVQDKSNPIKRLAMTAIIFSLIGWSLIVVDDGIPPRYAKVDAERMLNEVFSSTSAMDVGVTKTAIDGLTSDPNYRFIWGTGLYPIYYNAGGGEARTAKTGYAPSDNARLIQILVGTTNSQVIMDVQDDPGMIENGAVMIVLGCREELHTQAAVIYYPESEKILIDPLLFNGCAP